MKNPLIARLKKMNERATKLVKSKKNAEIVAKNNKKKAAILKAGRANDVTDDSKGYSVLRAAAYAQGYIGADDAKYEIAIHKKLADEYRSRGFEGHYGHRSFFVPVNTAALPEDTSTAERLKREIRSKMVDAYRGKLDPDEVEWTKRKVSKAMGTVDDTAGGTLVGFPTLGELIELQRNLEVFPNCGAQEIGLPPNGRMAFPKQTQGATSYFIGENTAITESGETTGELKLVAKKLATLVKVNNELMRFANPAAEAMIRFDMARSSALRADLSMLQGTGGVEIRGLITYEDIATYTATTTGTDGDTFQPQDVQLMEAKLPDAVQSPSAWIMRRDMAAAIFSRRTDAVSAADAKGLFAFAPVRTGEEGKPPKLFDTKIVRSNQVANTRTKGSGTALTYVILGYFPDWVIGRFGIMEFLASNQGDTAMLNDQTWLRAIQHLDAGARHGPSFVLCDSLVIA